MADEDDFLSRWSRRKRRIEVEDETAPDVAATPEDDASETEPEPVSEEEEAALLAKLGLPKPETLGLGDDFRGFMAPGVPSFLRRRALKVLWRSNPVLANLDGLNDYDDDFTSPELTKKVLATAYQVGRGILSRNVESEAPEIVPEAEPTDGTSGDEQPELLAANDETRVIFEPEQPAEELDSAPRPRRMRFET